MSTPKSDEAQRLLEPLVDAAGGSAQLLERLADRLGGKATVATVFGDPITAGGVTIIPVARAGFGFGGGSGRETSAEKVGEGGGGGGGVDVRPLGFIEIRDGSVSYRPIRDPWVDVAIPLTVIVLSVAAPRVVRAWIRLRRRKN